MRTFYDGKKPSKIETIAFWCVLAALGFAAGFIFRTVVTW